LHNFIWIFIHSWVPPFLPQTRITAAAVRTASAGTRTAPSGGAAPSSPSSHRARRTEEPFLPRARTAAANAAFAGAPTAPFFPELATRPPLLALRPPELAPCPRRRELAHARWPRLRPRRRELTRARRPLPRRRELACARARAGGSSWRRGARGGGAHREALVERRSWRRRSRRRSVLRVAGVRRRSP
jgi:hypothetical protein